MADNQIDFDRDAKRVNEWLSSPEGQRTIAEAARDHDQLELELEELKRIDYVSFHTPCDI